MVLRREILVLLLAVSYTLAQLKVSEVLDVDTFSAAQQLKWLPGSSLGRHHSRIQRKASSIFRRSLTSTERTCEWDDDSEGCLLSSSSMKSLLEKSDTEFASIVIQNIECEEKTTEEDCNKETPCAWGDEWSGCQYRDRRRGHEDSPCARAAPIFFDLEEAAALCPKQETRRACRRLKQCQWDATYSSCEVDFAFIAYGIKGLEDKQSQIMDPIQEAYSEEFRTPQYSHNATWQWYREYLLSRLECPSDIEELVCKYAEAYTTRILRPQLYCNGKHETNASSCNADTSCVWNQFYERCMVDRSLAGSNSRIVSRIFIDTIPDEIYRTYYDSAHTCHTHYEQDSCNGTCSWNPSERTCGVDGPIFLNLFAEAAQNSTDALCDFLLAHHSSDCHSQSSERKCQRKKQCYWSRENGCYSNREVYISVAADEDPRLKRRYSRLRKQCSSHRNETTC